MPDTDPKIGLALAGGAARGLAHLGIVDYFRENNLKISALSGCSMGSIVASVTALGWSDDKINKIAKGFKFSALLSLTWPTIGFSRLDKMQKLFQDFFGDACFEDTQIPLTLVAADVDTGEEVIFESGPIWQGVLASSAIPFLFEPMLYEGRRLSDGGLLRLNPTTCLKNKGLDAIIGTDIGFARTRTGPVKGMIDYLKQCLELLVVGQRQQSEELSALILRPDILDQPFLNFSKMDEYRQLGKEACLNTKNQIADIYNTTF